MTKTYETIIIGAGIAGLTAGIYAARKKMNFLIVADEFGGQMNSSGEVLNYPGIVETTGAEFRSIMQKQVDSNKFKVNEGEKVSSIEVEGEIGLSDQLFKVKTNKDKYLSKSVIVASGSHPRKLGVPGEDEFARKGVHYCAVCDGPLYSGKEVAIVGGGNSALEEVDFMLNIASKIYLINIEDKFTGHQYLIDRVEKEKKVEIISSAKTTEIKGDKMVTGLKYEHEGVDKEIKLEGVFVAIGRVPNSEFLKGVVELDDDRHVVVNCNTESSIPGLFAVGDVSSVHEYQYVISAGQGCIALLKAAKYLSQLN